MVLLRRNETLPEPLILPIAPAIKRRGLLSWSFLWPIHDVILTQTITRKILEPICSREKPAEAPASISVSYKTRSGRYFHGLLRGQGTKPSKTTTQEVDGDDADGARFLDPRRPVGVVKQKVRQTVLASLWLCRQSSPHDRFFLR